MEKSVLIFGNITVMDLVAAIIFFLMRTLYDVYKSRKKVEEKKEVFVVKIFLQRNWMRYAMSSLTMVGLLITVPDLVEWLSIDIFGQEKVYWNTGFSAAIGYAPIEVFLFFKRKFNNKLKKFDEDSNEERESKKEDETNTEAI